jgi:hypothetical protein
VTALSPSNPAVVIPVYKTDLHVFEWISLARAVAILASYPLYLLVPAGLQEGIASALKQRGLHHSFCWHVVPDHCLASVASYNQLMLTKEFYDFYAWQGITHLLIHQLDAYVFSDELRYWCGEEFSYVGAPIYPEGAPYGETHAQCVGVGGFSLRRIDDFILLLDANTRVLTFRDVRKLLPPYNLKGRVRILLRYIICRLMAKDRFEADSNSLQFWVGINEDVVYGLYAPLRDRRFRVPRYSVARRFSIDRYVNEELAALGRLPFGTHGWWTLPGSQLSWSGYIKELSSQTP